MNRETFLAGLGHEAGKTLPPQEVEALVAEARSHLEDSVRARLELGETPEEAERTALAAFGAVHEVGREVRRREPRIDRPFAASVLALLAFFAWAGGARAFPGLAYDAMIGIAVVVHGAFLFASARARRPQALVLGVVLLPLWLGTALLASTREVTIFDAPGTVGPWSDPRALVARQIDMARQDAQREWARPAILLEAYSRFERGENDLVPGASLFAADGRLRLRAENDRAEGERKWRQAVVGGTRLSTSSVMQANGRADALEAQGSRPWWAEVPYQLGPAADRIGLVQLLTVYGGGHMLLWAAGSATRRRRKGSDPRRFA